MASVPAELKYSKSHEWVRLEGDVVFVIAAGSENSLVEWLLLRTAQLS